MSLLLAPQPEAEEVALASIVRTIHDPTEDIPSEVRMLVVQVRADRVAAVCRDRVSRREHETTQSEHTDHLASFILLNTTAAFKLLLSAFTMLL